MQVSPPVLLLWMASCSETSPEGCGVSQPDRHRLSSTCAGSVPTLSWLSTCTGQCLHPKLSLLLTDVSVFFWWELLLWWQMSRWKGEYSGTERTQDYITHFSIPSLCWMYINLLSLLSSIFTSTVCMEHVHRHLFLRLYTETIYWQDSTNTGNNLSFH